MYSILIASCNQFSTKILNIIGLGKKRVISLKIILLIVGVFKFFAVSLQYESTTYINRIPAT